MLYSRTELRVLVVAAGILLVGLAVREWRAGFPELAERVESFDRETPAVAPERRGVDLDRGRAREAGPPPGHAAAPGPPASPPAQAPRPLDLNRAGEDQIARLPGIGPGLARRIVEERERRGRFDSPEALRHVLGLGPKKLAGLRDLITVGD